MNEFYEAVSNLFEELRCDFGEREYTVQPEEWSREEFETNTKEAATTSGKNPRA